jgi:hypothetical protein
MPKPTPTEKSLAAQMAAHESWAQTLNRSARTANARAALENRFLAEAGGDPVRGYVGESRTDAKVEAAYLAMIEFLAEQGGDGVSGRAVEQALSTEHPQKAVRAALTSGVRRGALVVVDGPRRAKLHRIAYPCAECGRPVPSQRDRHESCPPAEGRDE